MTIYISSKGTLPAQRPDKIISQISREAPLLNACEESRLYRAFKNGCLQSYNKLFNSHLRLVFKLARKFSKANKNLFEDLVSEGTLGLVYALKKFDSEKGRLCTYAKPWILHYIETYFIKHCFGNICMGRDTDTKKTFYALKKIGQTGSHDLGKMSDEQIEKISISLNVKKKTVENILGRILQNDLLDIWSCIHGGDNNNEPEDATLGQEEKLQKIKKEAKELKPLHKRIFLDRNFNNKSLREIASREKISVQRVSFIEKSSLASIRLSIVGKINKEVSGVI